MFSDLNCDVLIIGAGCAGLKAAETLLTHGVKNILVLEAQERLGGRINTLWLNDDRAKPLDMGASWIHGVIGNPLKLLVDAHSGEFKHVKTKFIDLYDHVKVYADTDGNMPSRELCDQIAVEYESWQDEAMSFWRAKPANYPNVQQFLDAKFQNYTKNDSAETLTLKKTLYHAFLNDVCTYTGCSSLEECSLAEFGSYLLFPGPDEEFPGGYGALIRHLANKLPETSIKLNHPVEKLSYDGENVKVECQNGAVFLTRHVIVTCSLNYLKETYKTLFNSKQEIFDEKKVNALNHLRMGIVNNHLLVYDQDIEFIPKEVDSLVPLYQENSDFKTFAFIKFYGNILRFFLYGDDAVKVEGMPDEEVIAKVTALLRRFFKDRTIPQPKFILRSKWHSNPYIRGSYSFIPTDSSNAYIDQLAEPIGTNRILFAGEATSENYFSTVHGAYMTGEKAAKRLVALLN